MTLEHLLIFGGVCALTCCLLSFICGRALSFVFSNGQFLVKGFGDGPIPVNMLYTEPQQLFADPLHPPASASKSATTDVNRDTLITIGWLNLRKGPQILHVPGDAERVGRDDAPSSIARCYTQLGQKDVALNWLEKGLKEHDDLMYWIRADPRYDSLRSEPRFEALLSRMNFPK